MNNMKWVAIETSVICICITVGMIVTGTAWPLFLLLALTTGFKKPGKEKEHE